MQDNIKEISTVVKKEKEKVCIIGCSDSKDLAPIKDSGYEFWGVNNLFLTMPDVNWTRWFEIHTIIFDGINFLRRGDHEFRGLTVNKYLEKLAQVKCPVYMQKKWPSIPNSIPYPKNEVVKRFGNYFTNTISWEIGLAIYLGFKEISIYGVDMAVGSEYQHQRPSCEYFIGIARGLGINVIVPDEADLLKTRFLYGFEQQKEDAFSKKVKHAILSMQKRRQQAYMQKEMFTKQVEQYIGGELGLSEMLKIWELNK